MTQSVPWAQMSDLTDRYLRGCSAGDTLAITIEVGSQSSLRRQENAPEYAARQGAAQFGVSHCLAGCGSRERGKEASPQAYTAPEPSRMQLIYHLCNQAVQHCPTCHRVTRLTKRVSHATGHENRPAEAESCRYPAPSHRGLRSTASAEGDRQPASGASFRGATWPAG